MGDMNLRRYWKSHPGVGTPYRLGQSIRRWTPLYILHSIVGIWRLEPGHKRLLDQGQVTRPPVVVSSSLSFFMILILSLVMGIVLNFTMFLCTIVNSALTTTIVGVLKGVGSTTLGFVVLGGVQVHALNVTGLFINTAGGVWYSFTKYQEKKNKPPKLMSDVEAHRK